MTTATLPTNQAAATLASLLPAAEPLSARAATPTERPDSGAEALVAGYVGATGLDMVLVVSETVTEALSQMENLTPVEALRPALEAAAEELGHGVLGQIETKPAGDVLTGGMEIYVLESAEGIQAWFGMRKQTGPAPSAQPLPAGSMQVLYDVEMTLTAEIGRTRLPVREVLSLTPGAVLELDRSAGSPADVMVNGRLVARGEVVVVDEDYALRVTEVVTPVESAAK